MGGTWLGWASGPRRRERKGQGRVSPCVARMALYRFSSREG